MSKKLNGLEEYFNLDTFNPFIFDPHNTQQQLEQLISPSHKEETSQKLLKMLLSREILIEILKSLQEGIQVADCEGIIRYVNPAFLKITGLKEDDREGKNVFEVSPDGGLAAVLRTGKPISNLRNYPKGSSVELVSSATPLYVFGKLIGALAINQDIRAVITLTEQLKKSNVLLESLSEKISYLSSANFTFDNIIGSSVAMNNVVEMARTAAQNDTTVLIQGETGTGKEVIANAIHNASKRASKPFISINCSAIPQNLLESEFFGHEKGSFTGALKRNLGKFELANGGTLFLDEIGDMDLALQAKILRAIQEKEIQRVGAENKILVDVRIIAATNRNLKKMISDGLFRQDLFYRLNVWNIVIPPLRERKVDIEMLAYYSLNKICRKLGKKNYTLTVKAIERMSRYEWPGNVRELENVLERAVLNSKGKLTIDADDLKSIITDETPTFADT